MNFKIKNVYINNDHNFCKMYYYFKIQNKLNVNQQKMDELKQDKKTVI